MNGLTKAVADKLEDEAMEPKRGWSRESVERVAVELIELIRKQGTSFAHARKPEVDAVADIIRRTIRYKYEARGLGKLDQFTITAENLPEVAQAVIAALYTPQQSQDAHTSKQSMPSPVRYEDGTPSREYEEHASKQTARQRDGVLQVCPECDIAECYHIRAQQKARKKEAADGHSCPDCGSSRYWDARDGSCRGCKRRPGKHEGHSTGSTDDKSEPVASKQEAVDEAGKRAYLCVIPGAVEIVYGVSGAMQAYVRSVLGDIDGGKDGELAFFEAAFQEEENWTWSADRRYPIEYREQFEDGFIAFYHIPAVHPAAKQIASGWQPIETAPKIGLAVLLYEQTYGGKCYPIIGHYGNGWIADSEMFWAEDGPQHCSLSPTHWQPLPAPPGRDVAAKQIDAPQVSGEALEQARRNGHVQGQAWACAVMLRYELDQDQLLQESGLSAEAMTDADVDAYDQEPILAALASITEKRV